MTTSPVPDTHLPTVTITTRRAHGRVAVTMTGEIDAALRDHLDTIVELVGRTGDQVVVDLAGVTFFSAEGARFLARLRLAAPDGGLALLATSPSVDLVLALCDLRVSHALLVPVSA